MTYSHFKNVAYNPHIQIICESFHTHLSQLLTGGEYPTYVNTKANEYYQLR